jgi:hypothetical protein
LAAADDPKFALHTDLGGGRTMHVRTMDADADENVVEEVVIVSTDIQAPKATAFAKVTDQALNADSDGDAASGLTATARDLGDALVSTDTADAAVLKNIMASEFAKAAGTTVTHTFNAAVADDANTADVDETKAAAKVDGTFNGASGTYKCTGTTDCTVTVNDKGALTAASNGWIFTPDAGAKSDVPDADFLHYGFWLQRTKEDGKVTSYEEVATFASSSVMASGSEVADVDGSATYTGRATGVYVKNVHNPDSTIASATSGHFTATAKLKAYFGQVLADADDQESGTIAPNLLNSISGTVSSLRNGAGEVIDNNWTVKLDKGVINTTDGTFAGDTTGGGDYSGTFYGPAGDVDHDDDSTTAEINTAPHTVVGEFDATFDNGSVAGAFGAREDD